MPADGVDLLVDGIGGEVGEEVLVPLGRVMDRVRTDKLKREKQDGEDGGDRTEKGEQSRRHPNRGGRSVGDGGLAPGAGVRDKGDGHMREYRGEKPTLAPKHQHGEFEPA